jgi:hypothetical protein
MDAMLGISLYSYSYLNYQKCCVFLIITYFYFLTKLEKRAEQFLPGSEGSWEERWAPGQGREMAQCMHI